MRPVTWTLHAQEIGRGVTLTILPPKYLEGGLQHETMQSDRRNLGFKQRERVECAVMEGRGIVVKCHTMTQAGNVTAWFAKTFSGDED